MRKDRLTAICSVIPAQPGYFKLTPLYDTDYDLKGNLPTGFYREPIIAWVISGSHDWKMGEVSAGATGITPDEGTVSGNTAVLWPDGRVVIPCDRSWNSEQEYFNYVLTSMERI